ncbi:hypothetical protein [Tenacibaculum aiptasiae]|uniref:hypothetical protein n=1 Tax=Tenacibaculum aiptasiae TaxID=426481 RepID=UPI003B59FA46
MNKHILQEITYHTLTEKEKDSLLVNFKGVLNKEMSDSKYDSEVYVLNDNRIIFDMMDMKTFLFNDLDDLKNFKKLTSKIAKESVKSKIQVKDKNFIDKIDLYTTFFLNSYDLDFSDVNELKKLDSLLESFNEKEILKHKNSLVAIIGCFLKENVINGEWIYLKNDAVNTINPVINCDNGLFEPIYILEDIVYNKKSFFLYIDNLIKNYNR